LAIDRVAFTDLSGNIGAFSGYSIAILARGFDYNISARTYRRQLRFHQIDYIVMGVILAMLLGALLLNSLGLANPTEQFILKMLEG
jgi:hypothetical protein